MTRNHYTTYTLLKIVCLGTIAALMSSCVTTSEVPGGKKDFTFVQMCDPQLGMSGYEQDLQKFGQAVRQINALSPDFVVICGDLVGRPERDTFTDFIETKAKFRMPAHCVPGNHDVGNQPTPKTLAYYRKSIGKDYYSLKHKGYAFIFVNSQLWQAPVEGETEKQDAWLRAELKSAAKAQLPVFIVQHHPLYAKAVDEKESYGNLPIPKRKELLDLFETSGVVAILTGHAHRIIINDAKGMQLVSGQATSRSHGSPLGFRLWHIKEPRPFVHESVPLQAVDSAGAATP